MIDHDYRALSNIDDIRPVPVVTEPSWGSSPSSITRLVLVEIPYWAQSDTWNFETCVS